MAVLGDGYNGWSHEQLQTIGDFLRAVADCRESVTSVSRRWPSTTSEPAREPNSQSAQQATPLKEGYEVPVSGLVDRCYSWYVYIHTHGKYVASAFDFLWCHPSFIFGIYYTCTSKVQTQLVIYSPIFPQAERIVPQQKNAFGMLKPYKWLLLAPKTQAEFI